MKTFRELAECLARIPPKITLYGLLFKYNYVGCLLLLMFSIDLLFAIKNDFVGFRRILNLECLVYVTAESQHAPFARTLAIGCEVFNPIL